MDKLPIVERLRGFGKSDPADDTWAAMDVMSDAADLITELVAALDGIIDYADWYQDEGPYGEGWSSKEKQQAMTNARAALARARSKGE